MDRTQLYTLKIATDRVQFLSYIPDGNVIKEADPYINLKIAKVYKTISKYLDNDSDNCTLNAYISQEHEFVIEHNYYNLLAENERTVIIDTLSEISEELIRIIKMKAN